jgi:L-alanine-DL-glutamate epimerase-like enolase superfamily enzyme
LAQAYHLPVTVHYGLGVSLYLAAALHAHAALPSDLPQGIRLPMFATANEYPAEPLRCGRGQPYGSEGPGWGVTLEEEWLGLYLY